MSNFIKVIRDGKQALVNMDNVVLVEEVSGKTTLFVNVSKGGANTSSEYSLIQIAVDNNFMDIARLAPAKNG